MAVITQFVVVREGVEKMTFTSKKEADAYDKMLDVVDSLVPFLSASDVNLDENTCEQLAFYLYQYVFHPLVLHKSTHPLMGYILACFD